MDQAIISTEFNGVLATITVKSSRMFFTGTFCNLVRFCGNGEFKAEKRTVEASPAPIWRRTAIRNRNENYQ